MLENTELKKKIAKLEEEKLELKQTLISMDSSGGAAAAPRMMSGASTSVSDMNEMH